MARQSSLSIELTGLGQVLASAMSQMKSSKEFRALEASVVHALTGVSTSLAKSLGVAKRSPTTRKLGRRIGRVLAEGKKTGKAEARRAKDLAAKNIRRARMKLKQMTQRISR